MRARNEGCTVQCPKCGRWFQGPGTFRLHAPSRICARRVARIRLYAQGFAPVRSYARVLQAANIRVQALTGVQLTNNGPEWWGPAWAIAVCAASDSGWKNRPTYYKRRIAVLKALKRSRAKQAAILSVAMLAGYEAVAKMVDLPIGKAWGDVSPLWWLDPEDDRR